MATLDLTKKLSALKGVRDYGSDQHNVSIVVVEQWKWIEIAGGIDKVISKIGHLINSLEEAQKNQLTVIFDEKEERKLKANVASLTQQIMSHFYSCEIQLKQLQSHASEHDSVKNCIKSKISTLSSLSERFRTVKMKYTTKLQRIESLDDDTGNYLPNRMQSTLDNKLLEDRTQAITRISEEVNILARMFKDLNMRIKVQGTILDRIDYNIAAASGNVGRANVELKKAYEHKRGCKSTICIIILLLMIVILSTIIGTRSKT